MRFDFTSQPELAPTVSVDLQRVRAPQYGRWLDDLAPGQVFVHPRGYTFERAEMRAFAATFMQANPLFLNAEHARAHGFRDLPASPQLVFNVVLSLGVQNDSEKAMANLGYYQARFLRPVYSGDTICSLTRVVTRRERGPDKPGIAHIQTLGLNQEGQVVLQYERKIMVRPRPAGTSASAPPSDGAAFPWLDQPACELPLRAPGGARTELTGPNTYFEDFAPGDIIVHANGRTITDEHVPWTYRVGNTHPLHYDRVYSRRLSGAMSGEPIVYGGLVFAWLDGLASRDVSENALWELGFSEGYHTQPAVTGDTVAAISRVLQCDPCPAPDCPLPCGVVTFQLIGVKNLSGAQALERYGAELFQKESDKKEQGKEKIEAKIFEIERRLLLKRRSAR